MKRLPSLIALTAATFLSAACGDEPTAVITRRAPPPAFAIYDGAHNGGNPGFFLLPPLVANPAGDRELGDSPFAASAAPRVEICQLAGDPNAGSTDCVAGPALVVFSGSQITVAPPTFQVNWRTDLVPLNTTAFYRIQVFVGSQLMGFADIDPVTSSRDLKHAKTGEVIPLMDGRTLPIKFTIEADGLCPAGRPCTKARVTNTGGSFTLPSGTGGVLLPAGWLPAGIGEVTLTLEDVALGPDNLCHVGGVFTGAGLAVQFEGCMSITTDPALTPGPTTGIQQEVIVGLCLEADGDNSAIREFLQLFKSDPGLPLVALADADPSGIEGFSCEGYTGTPAPPPVIGLASPSLLHFARSGLGDLTNRLTRLVRPQPVYAIDLGEGGKLPIGEFFSRFGWGSRATLTTFNPPTQTATVGQLITVTVQATGVVDHETPREECEDFDGESDEMGCIAVHPAVPVTFAVTGGGGTVGGSATFTAVTIANGTATATWQLGATPGVNTLVINGAGGSVPVTLTANAAAPVLATTTALRSTYTSDQLSVVGEPVFLEASVVASPTGGAAGSGQVQFFDGAASLGIANLAPNGTASITVPSLSRAAHALTARFLGTATHAASTSPVFTLHMVEQFRSLAAYQAALGDFGEQTQDFDETSVGTPVSSIIAGVLNVGSPFPIQQVSSCSSSNALFGIGNEEDDPRSQLTEGGFINSFYDLLFASPRIGLTFDIASKDPNSLPSVIEISGVGTTTARFDVSNTSGAETTPVFVGMIASTPLSRVIVHEGLESPGGLAEEMCLDNFRVSTGPVIP